MAGLSWSIYQVEPRQNGDSVDDLITTIKPAFFVGDLQAEGGR